jgi:hypothetical protein
MTMSTRSEAKEGEETVPAWVEIVRRQVDSLRFGVVQIVVHDSEVTQIDKTERVRLEKTQKTFSRPDQPEA